MKKIVKLVAVFIGLMGVSVMGNALHAQEYINETFQLWTQNGSESVSPVTFVDGTQTIACVDGETRTFSYKQCVVNNAAVAANKTACTDGALLVRNSNNGIVTLPKLPNIGKIMIAREGKTPDKVCRFQLEVLQSDGVTWTLMEADTVTVTTGCAQWTYHYQSADSVQVRLKLAGNSATHLYWLYVEGLEGGSGIPLIPDKNIPLPDPSTVTLLPDKADTVAFETLVGVAGYGWDPTYRGILINWHRDFPNHVNNDSGGAYDVRDSSSRHDSQNDVRALQHFYWFKALHNNTPYFDYIIDQLLPTVKSKYAKPSLTKGWLYFVIERLRDYTDRPADKAYWENSMLYWASNTYSKIDPATGIFSSTDMGNCDCKDKTIYLDLAYRVDQQFESGAALVHAGTVFNHPEWVSAGYKQMKVAYNQAFVPKYGLFGRIVLLGRYGYTIDKNGVKSPLVDYGAFTGKLWDAQVKMGEVSEQIDAVMRAGIVTTDPEIKAFCDTVLAQMLTALPTAPIHDNLYKGFHVRMYVANDYTGALAGSLGTGTKEMRQASLLGTINLANRYIAPKWYSLEKEMYDVITNSAVQGMYLPNVEKNPTETINQYRRTLAGYTYQTRTNWTIYQGGGTAVAENWVSNESNSLALLGLMEYLTATYTLGYVNPLMSVATGITTPNTSSSWFVKYDNTLKITDKSCKQIRIYNDLGHVMQVNTQTDGLYDISQYPSGIYIITGVCDNGNKQGKFVK